MTEMICQQCGEVNGGSRSKCMLCGGPTWNPEYAQDSREVFTPEEDTEEQDTPRDEPRYDLTDGDLDYREEVREIEGADYAD